MPCLALALKFESPKWNARVVNDQTLLILPGITCKTERGTQGVATVHLTSHTCLAVHCQASLSSDLDIQLQQGSG